MLKEIVTGLPVPLFDRFNEELDDARVGEPYRIQELSLLLESIQKEIDNLLNTRLPPRPQAILNWEPLSEPQTVLDFGLPALSALSSSNPVDVALLCRTIVGKIASFEPRLQEPKLDLHAVEDDPAALTGTLRGLVRLNRIDHPVNFPVSLRRHGGAVTLFPAQEVRSQVRNRELPIME
jgi:type VI secretion system lysozyme-like protein